jgi:hypothetical protein
MSEPAFMFWLVSFVVALAAAVLIPYVQSHRQKGFLRPSEVKSKLMDDLARNLVCTLLGSVVVLVTLSTMFPSNPLKEEMPDTFGAMLFGYFRHNVLMVMFEVMALFFAIGAFFVYQEEKKLEIWNFFPTFVLGAILLAMAPLVVLFSWPGWGNQPWSEFFQSILQMWYVLPAGVLIYIIFSAFRSRK